MPRMTTFSKKLTSKIAEERQLKRVCKNAVEQGEGRATALVSMSKSEKHRLTSIAKAHGLSLSAFFRLATDEYIANHNW